MVKITSKECIKKELIVVEVHETTSQCINN